MILPSPKELHYFHDVALTLNFSHAARLLHTSQPALSMAIKRLEDKLGVKLFQRLQDGLILTSQGQDFLLQVRDLLNKWENLRSQFASGGEEIKGRITIGCHSVQSQSITKCIADLTRKHPALDIHLKCNVSQQITQGLLDNTIDIGLAINGSEKHAKLSYRKIRATDLAFWVSDTVTPDNDLLSGRATVLFDSSSHLMKALLHRLRLKKIPVARVLDINDTHTLAHMAFNGCGIAILYECYVEIFYPNKLHRIHELPSTSDNFCLIYRKEDENVHTIQTVINEMRDFALRQFNTVIA